MTPRLSWRIRARPLPAAAVLAGGEAVRPLARSTARWLDSGRWLRAGAATSWLLVLGEKADLPWSEGARYLGWDTGVLMPTTHEVWPGPSLIRSAAGADPLDLVVVVPDAVLLMQVPQRRADAALLR